SFSRMDILLISLPVLLLSVVVHEYAHGWMALKQGDPTAAMLGRLTLNPIPHIDPVGSILFPMLLVLMQAGVILGWARPVPVDPRNFPNYRRGDHLASLAGLPSQFLPSGSSAVAPMLPFPLGRLAPVLGPSADILIQMARFGVLIHLILAFFNLLPIPPLDGSHVLYHLLPAGLRARYRALSRYGILILLAILLFAPSVLVVVSWPVRALQELSEAFIRLWV